MSRVHTDFLRLTSSVWKGNTHGKQGASRTVTHAQAWARHAQAGVRHVRKGTRKQGHGTRKQGQDMRTQRVLLMLGLSMLTVLQDKQHAKARATRVKARARIGHAVEATINGTKRFASAVFCCFQQRQAALSRQSGRIVSAAGIRCTLQGGSGK